MNNFPSFRKKAAASPESPNGENSTSSSWLGGLSGLHLPTVTLPSLGVMPIGIDSTKNTNASPSKCLHPKVADTEDPEYTIDEAALRGAMYFPESWKNRMDKQPVICVPPSGMYGGTAYRHNFAILLRDWDYVNYMWVNIPGAQADWSAKNAEFVAYAIHYVAHTTGQKVALIAWSQGNLSIQWSLKYWPQVRQHVNNFISVSADFHGTLTAYAAPLPTIPSFINQRYNSNFIRTLRANGGDSAYVPHTSIYSSFFDEIVQPQAGEAASAYMKDEREVGVLNVDIQQVCPGTPAGFMYGHGNLIYNAVTWALAKDAIQNGGPARLDRIDMRTVSKRLWAPGLSISDCVVSIAEMSTFMMNALTFPHKVFKEGPLPAYALAECEALGPEPEVAPEHQAIIDQSKKQSAKIGLPAAIDPKAMASAAIQQLKTGQPGNLPQT